MSQVLYNLINYSFIMKTLIKILFRFKTYKVLNLLQINNILLIKLNNMNDINNN